MKTKAQIPASGISQTANWPTAKAFTVKCDCHSSDHDVNMWIEVDSDREAQDVEVGFYVETWSPIWNQSWARLRAIWDLVVHGVHRQQHHLILNKQTAVNFAETILREVQAIEEAQHGTKKSNRK